MQSNVPILSFLTHKQTHTHTQVLKTDVCVNRDSAKLKAEHCAKSGN
jgi:hypothetical protein